MLRNLPFTGKTIQTNHFSKHAYYSLDSIIHVTCIVFAANRRNICCFAQLNREQLLSHALSIFSNIKYYITVK